MKVAIAGPYSADTETKKQINLDKLNKVAALVYQSGHIPIIGVNAALPVVAQLPENIRYNAIMDISLALVSECDAMIIIAESPGANRERDKILSMGKPVYTSFQDFIKNHSSSD